MREPKKKVFVVSEEIDANDIIGLLATAFDSGATNYWARRANVNLPEGFDLSKIPWLKSSNSWSQIRRVYIAPLVEEGSVVLFDNDKEGKTYTLNLESIRRGVQVMSSKFRSHWMDFRTGNSNGNTGDVFVQCCVIGDVIYG